MTVPDSDNKPMKVFGSIADNEEQDIEGKYEEEDCAPTENDALTSTHSKSSSCLGDKKPPSSIQNSIHHVNGDNDRRSLEQVDQAKRCCVKDDMDTITDYKGVKIDSDHYTQKYRKQKTTIHVWVLSFFAAIGGFLIGYNTGVVSGALLLLKERFSLSSFRQELVVSVLIGGGFTASLFGGVLNDWLGRKNVIFLTSFAFTIGSLVMGLAHNITMLIVGRFILGIGISK